MKLKQYLNEFLLLEKLNMNKPIKVVANNKYTWQAQFNVADAPFRFVADFEENLALDDPAEWGITFWNMKHPGSFTIGSTDITGDVGTSSLQVFSGVASALKKFIQAKNPDVFFFSAEEKSRVRLYNRFARMIAQKLNYKMDKTMEDGEYMYQFTK